MSLDDSDDCKNEASTAVNSTDDAYMSLTHTRIRTPAGWTKYIHPQGWAYFRNDEYKLVVDENIRKAETLAHVNEFYSADPPEALPDGVEACLLGSAGAYFYLIVDHNQCVAEHANDKLTRDSEDLGDFSLDNLLRRRRLYWNFVQGHPSHTIMPRRALTEAIDSVRAYYFDNLTNGQRSTVPFSRAECDDLLRHLEAHQGSTVRETSMVTLVAWILREVYSYRHAEGYGQYTVNQYRTRPSSLAPPVYVPRRPSAIANRLLSFLINVPFFGIPQTYLEHIQHASEFRGRLSSLHQSWKEYTEQLIREYSDFILIATVLLSATVGMLSVGDIGQVSRVCSIMAASAALGSIATGVFFVWRHQRDARVSTTRTFAYMNNAHRNFLGLPGHALFLSLPPVLLAWSLIGFTVAIVAYTLQPVTASPTTDVASTAITLAIFLLVLLCTTIAIYIFIRMWRWESRTWKTQIVT